MGIMATLIFNNLGQLKTNIHRTQHFSINTDIIKNKGMYLFSKYPANSQLRRNEDHAVLTSSLQTELILLYRNSAHPHLYICPIMSQTIY